MRCPLFRRKVAPLPDRKIDALLADALAGDEDGVGAALDDAFQRNAAELLIRKLRLREEGLDLAAAPALILALAKRASKIPISRDILFGTFVFSQAAILISQVVARMEEGLQDAILASVAENTDSLPFISQIMRWSRTRVTDGRDRGFLTSERLSDFTADTYTSLSKLLDPERVFAQLRSIYGAALDKAEWEGSERDDSDVDRRIAEQFSAIHRCPAPETEEEEQIKD